MATRRAQAARTRTAEQSAPALGQALFARLAPFAPTARSLAVAAAILVLGLGMYTAARETSLFAVRTIEVTGAPRDVGREVRRALAPVAGTSLVVLEPEDVLGRLASLPVVASATYDREFPHTLRVHVRAERPLAVARTGAESWLVSARGRVLALVPRGARPRLPRLWLGKTRLTRGATMPADSLPALRALAPLARSGFLRAVRSSLEAGGAVTLLLRSGAELRLGEPGQLRLKLAIGRRILAGLPPAAGTYVDVTVPERPVVSWPNPQVVS